MSQATAPTPKPRPGRGGRAAPTRRSRAGARVPTAAAADPAGNFRIDVISPALAREMLEAAGIDPASVGPKAAVKGLVAQMAAGRWRMNGETIVVGSDDSILDGKRRLAAAAVGGVGFPAIVAYGVSPDALNTLNSHKRRTTRDMLHIREVDSVPERVAAAALVGALARGAENYESGGMTVPAQFVTDLFEAYPSLSDSILVARRAAREIKVGRAILAACHFMFSQVDPKATEEFFAHLVKRGGRNRAVRALRRELALVAGTGRVPRRVPIAGLVKAWNAFRDGASDPVVSIMPGERMPRISGDPQVALPESQCDPAPVDETTRRRTYRDAVDRMVRGVRISLRVFTPEESQRILETSNGPAPTGVNRTLAEAKVRMFARDMADGAWIPNGQAVKFGVSGRAVDGQHRFAACVRSGVPFSTLVVEGVEDEAFETMDLGRERDLTQAIKDGGTTNYSLDSDVTRVLWRWENGFLGKHERASVSSGVDLHARWHDRIRASTSTVAYKHRDAVRLLMSESQATALHLILSERDPGAATAFMLDLVLGAGLALGDPVLALRNTLMSRRGSADPAARTSGTRLKEHHFMLVAFETWNMRRAGLTSRATVLDVSVPRQLPALA